MPQAGRRGFLKTAAGAIGLAVLGTPGRQTFASGASSRSGLAMLFDTSRCIGCWWCYAACKNANSLPETARPDPRHPPELSPDTWSTLRPVRTGETWSFLKLACVHCSDAVCVEVCPTGALSYSELGFVQFERDKCIGCGYCAQSCPFEVPKIEANEVTGVGVMSKCTFCADRVKQGLPTACAEACPTGALKFGARGELLEEGRQRVAELARTNPEATLYGGDGAGDLHVLYVLTEPSSVYGLPEDPRPPVAATLRNGILRPLSWVLWGAVAAGLAFNVLVAQARHKLKAEHD